MVDGIWEASCACTMVVVTKAWAFVVVGVVVWVILAVFPLVVQAPGRVVCPKWWTIGSQGLRVHWGWAGWWEV